MFACRRAKRETRSSRGSSSVLSKDVDELSGIYYQPKTRETRSTYEVLLSFIQAAIGDQPRDILCGAADEVLATLKEDKLKERDKKKEVESLLGQMTEERFSLLVNLGRKITDYTAVKESGETGTQADIDEDYGVAVVFEGEEEEAEKAEYCEDIREEDSADEAEGEEADDKLILHADLDSSALGGQRESDELHPRAIDAYYLQRELNKFYNDHIVSQKKGEEVLDILKDASDDRDCENKLVLLLGFDQFAFIKLLRQNRMKGMVYDLKLVTTTHTDLVAL